MGYVIYGQPGFGSMVVEAAFAVAGAPYRLEETRKGPDGSYSAAFLALNPRGQVPALALPDGSVMTETTAILLHLADALPQGVSGASLAPPPGSAARAQHDRWLTFIQANIYEGILRTSYPERYVTDQAAAAAVKAAAQVYVMDHFRILEAVIAGPYLFGAKICAVDLYLWMLVQWVDQAPLAAACPKVMALCATVAGRADMADVALRNAE